jgi:hypothetical protein
LNVSNWPITTIRNPTNFAYNKLLDSSTIQLLFAQNSPIKKTSTFLIPNTRIQADIFYTTLKSGAQDEKGHRQWVR